MSSNVAILKRLRHRCDVTVWKMHVMKMYEREMTSVTSICKVRTKTIYLICQISQSNREESSAKFNVFSFMKGNSIN